MRTRIKICGITSPEIASIAVGAGADAIGLMFYPKSSRYLELEQAEAIRKVLPAFVSSVAVFVNPTPDYVQAVVERLGTELLQFHGEESPEFCAGFRRPYVKVIRVDDHTDLDSEVAKYPDAAAIMLDTRHESAYGGTGIRFDWELAAGSGFAHLVLAGGIDHGNVGEAISLVKPFAVDVSSSVETDGVKDAGKIQKFCRAVREADSNGEVQ